MNQTSSTIACVLAIMAPTFAVHAQSLNFESPVSLGNINTAKVTEASGLAVSAANPGVLWTHNDGPKDHIYAFNMSGGLLADFDFSKNPNDIEDIAIGPGPNAGQP